MKKTITAILLIAMIAVAIALPSFAAETIYFTSVNNILMPLRDDTMPISYSGSMYVPYSVFNSNELGTFAVYSQSAQIVTVFGDGVQLYYNLQDGTTYDTYGNTYRHRAISSNGRIYIPVAFTCEYFAINYSIIYGNKYGNIVRMTVGDVLDDESFSGAASALMKSRLDDYNKSKASPTPTAVFTPTPTPTPSRTPSTSEPSVTDRSDVKVYLSFFGLDPKLTPRILTALQPRSTPAAFFVSAEDIAAYPDLIRRISGSGHSIGIICGEDYEGDYAAASSLLFDAAHTSAFITAGTAGFITYTEDGSGLILYCSTGDAQPLSLTAAVRKLERTESRADLIFTTDEQTAEELPALLRAMRAENYDISLLTEVRAARQDGVEN